jgi:AcrR family transcriptional regulator
MARVKISDIRRREIIDAAYKVFSDKGYHKTGIADIAAELEMGHGTLYRYFKNKLDIATSVIDDIIARITEVVTAEPAQEITTVEEYRERLVRIGGRFFDLLEKNPDAHRILFYESLNIDESITRKVNALFDLFASMTEVYLRNGIDRGFLKPEIHIHEAAYAINAMLFEAARRLSQAPEIDEDAKKAWSDTIIGLMLDGLAV